MTHDVTVLAIPAYAAAIGVEVAVLPRISSRPVRGYKMADASASIAMGVLSLLTGIAWAAAALVLSRWAYAHRLLTPRSSWAVWLAALVGWDLAYYWSHRAGHRIRFFWAAHVQHHSSERFNFSTALRQPVTAVYELLFFTPLAFLGLKPAVVVAAGGINLVYQFWIHTEAVGRLPRPIELVFNTPSHHRVHHGSNREYLDRNYGGILIVWDRLFGTFEPERAPVVYGLTHNIGTHNLWTIVTHEYRALWASMRSAPSLPRALACLVAPPGWSPARERP